MRYYRELDIDFSEIKQAILNDFDSEKNNVFWNIIGDTHLPILEKMFKPYGLTPIAYVLINASGKTYIVHTDMSKADMRINIPILNCEHSATHFFKPKTEEIRLRKKQMLEERWKGLELSPVGKGLKEDTSLMKNNIHKFGSAATSPTMKFVTSPSDKVRNAGADFFHYDHSEVELVDQLKLTKPTILRIKEPHAVAVLKDASPRLSLTVEFIEDLTPLLEHGLEPQP